MDPRNQQINSEKLSIPKMKTIILPNGMELPDGLEVPDSIDPDATKWLDENSEESPSQPLITGETPNSGISVTPNEAANEKPGNGQFNDQFDALGRPMLSQTPTPVYKKPAVDASGMPLPRRVDEIDQNATRVIPIQREVTPVSKPARSLSKFSYISGENHQPSSKIRSSCIELSHKSPQVE